MTFYLGRAFNPVNFGRQTLCWWCGLEFQNSESESLILAQRFFTCGPWTSTVHTGGLQGRPGTFEIEY